MGVCLRLGFSLHDIFYGRDFLFKIGLDTCFSTKTTNLMNRQIPMKTSCFWDDPTAIFHSLAKKEEKEDDIDETPDCDCFDNMMAGC
jgi:hypothetical protein